MSRVQSDKTNLPTSLTLSLPTLTTLWNLSARENDEQHIYFDGCKVATVQFHLNSFIDHVRLPDPFNLQLLMIREHLFHRDLSSVLPRWSVENGRIMVHGQTIFNWLGDFDQSKISKYQFKSGQLIVCFALRVYERENERVRILWKDRNGEFILHNAKKETFSCRRPILIDQLLAELEQTEAIKQCRRFVCQ